MDAGQRRIIRDGYVRELVEPTREGVTRCLLVNVADEMVELRRPTGERVMVLTAEAGAEAARQVNQRARALFAKAGGHPFQLVVIGGDDKVRRALKRAVPAFGLLARYAVHLGDDRTARRFGPLGYDVEAVEPALFSAALLDPKELERRLEEGRRAVEDRDAQQAEEQRWAAFSRGIPPAIGSIGVAYLLMYAASRVWRGDLDGPALWSLGAYSAHDVRSGEWWRLLSSTVLPQDFMGALIGGTLLIIMGQFTEKVLGSSRLLVLYVTSGLAGSLVTVYSGREGIWLGAWGASLGVAGGAIAVAWRLRKVLPSGKVLRICWGPGWGNQILPVIWALFISRWSAVHLPALLGSFVAGFALVASGLFTKGLPASRVEDPELLRPKVSRGWQVLATACVLLLAGSVVTALAVNRPWELRHLAGVERHEMGDAGLTIELPRLRNGPVSSEGHPGTSTLEFGDPARDAVWGRVSVWSRIQSNPQRMEDVTNCDALMEAWRTAMLEVMVPRLLPKDVAPVGAARLRWVGDSQKVIADFVQRDGVRGRTYLVFIDCRIVDVTVLSRLLLKDEWGTLLDAIAASVRQKVTEPE